VNGGRTTAWLIATALAVTGAACGQGGEVRAGAPEDAAAVVQRGVTGALAADTYRVRAHLTVGGASGSTASTDPVTGTASVTMTFPACGIGGPAEVIREVAVGDGGHRTAYLDPASGAVQVIRDDRGPLIYVATATLPGGAGAPTPWASVGPDDLLAALATNAPSVLSVLWESPPVSSPHGLLKVIQQSTATVTDVDRGEIDGTPVAHQRITVDPARFAVAQRELTRSSMPGIDRFGGPPGTIDQYPLPSEPAPDLDTWVDDAGTLRRVVMADPTPTTGSGAWFGPVRLELTFSGFGAPFPESVPPAGSVTDLGALPATVLLPQPSCADRSGSPPSGAVAPAAIEPMVAYMTCVSEARQRAAPGQTVREWLAQFGSFGVSSTTCPLPDPFPH
jgi:hypothetical protein